MTVNRLPCVEFLESADHLGDALSYSAPCGPELRSQEQLRSAPNHRRASDQPASPSPGQGMEELRPCPLVPRVGGLC